MVSLYYHLKQRGKKKVRQSQIVFNISDQTSSFSLFYYSLMSDNIVLYNDALLKLVCETKRGEFIVTPS